MATLLTLGLLLLAAPPAGAEPAAKGSTLADCFQAALQRSELLAEQEELVIQAEEHYRQALGTVMPQLSFSGALSLQDTTTQTTVKATLSQPLFRGFREFAALRQSQHLIAYQKESRQWAGLQLYQDVAQNFFTVLSLEKDLLHLDTELGLYQQRIAELKSYVRIGRARANEILSVQAAQAVLKSEQVQVRSQWVVARELFAFLTGLPAATPLQAEPAIASQIPGLEDYLARLEQRPDILAAGKRLAAVRESVAIAKGGRWPTLDASANVYAVRPSPHEDQRWDAQIALTLPIFRGGIVTSEIKEAESQVRQAELTLQRLRRLNEQILRNDYHLLRAAQDQVAALEEAAALTHQNYLAEARDYRNGLVNNLELLQALATNQDARRALDRARYAVSIQHQRLEADAAKITF